MIDLYLEAAGFGHVINVFNYTIDPTHILALLERWRPETHMFHLPTGECTITLEDVHMLLGLPIEGKVVNGRVQHANALCEKVLGKDMIEGDTNLRGQRINLKTLKKYYESLELDENSTEK